MKTVRLKVAAPAAGAHRVSLLEHDTGNELASGVLPTADLEGAQWTPEKIQEFFASAEAGRPSPNLEAIGNQLAQWLLPGAVKQAFEALRANGVRVLLEIEPQALAKLPWELARLGAVPQFLDAQSPFARFQAGAPRAKAEWPLRVMIVVGAAEGDKAVDAEAEIAAIERELHPYGHSIDREIVRRPSKTSLFTRLREFRPHVLLFIGHCETDPIVGAPVLRFQLAPATNAWNWTPGDVAVDLNQLGWVPCLVILNACRTHEPAASFRVSEAFMHSGASACIAMQGDVRGDLAGVFSAYVMRGLCEGEPLDVAVAKARGEVMRQTDLLQRDWAFPVLSLAVEPETLFPPRSACATRGALATAFRDVTWFAGRRDERRRFRSQVQLNPEGVTAPQLLVVTGPRRCGKSHLVRWCLEQFALVYGGIVRYVPMSGAGSSDFVTVLRQIRDPANGSGDLQKAALDAFHWKLNALLAGGVLKEWSGQSTDDQGLPYDPQKARAEHAIRDICKAFGEVLRETAKERPVLIALDRFTYNQTSLPVDAMTDALFPHLLLPLRDAPSPGLTIVLVMDEEECKRYGTNRFVPDDEWIRIPADLSEQPERLAQELFWYPRDEALKEVLDKHVIPLAIKSCLPPGSRPNVGYLEKLMYFAVGLVSDENTLRDKLHVHQMM